MLLNEVLPPGMSRKSIEELKQDLDDARQEWKEAKIAGEEKEVINGFADEIDALEELIRDKEIQQQNGK